MRVHEKRIVNEVCSSKGSVHLLYQGVRLRKILGRVIKKAEATEETLVVLGAPDTYVQMKTKKDSMCVYVGEELQDHPQEENDQGKKEFFTIHKTSQGRSRIESKTEIKMDSKTKTINTRKKINANTRKTVSGTAQKMQSILKASGDNHRKKMYEKKGCIFAPERAFLFDILKKRVPENNIRVLYLLGDKCKDSLKNIREFILFASRCMISVLLVCEEKYSFSDIVTQGHFPSATIFLYPFFRVCVSKSFGDFDITEKISELDQGRIYIQSAILDLYGKLARLPEAEKFETYIWHMRSLLRRSVSYLHSTDISCFVEYFRYIVSTENSIYFLELLYGKKDTVNAHLRYQHIISWTLLETVNEIVQIAEGLAEGGAEAPKKILLQHLLSQLEGSAVSVIGAHLPNRPFRKIDISVNSISKINSEMKRIVAGPNPHIILVNYTLSAIRKIKMQRNIWRKRGIEIEVILLTVRDSAEEMFVLEETKNEKDRFISAIGIKKNRPANVDRKLFSFEAPHVSAPTLAIDVRELKSSLPLYLAKRFTGVMSFEFLFLLQGDYVCNRTHFIERKSMPDLIESYRTGRLAKQLESILYINKEVYLLIEFPDQEKMSLMSYTAKREIEIDLVFRMVSLMRTLRNVKLFFSNSNALSATLVQKIAGKPSSSAEAHVKVSPALVEALLAIPGITHKNVSLILDNFTSIYDLATSSKERLTMALGKALSEQVYEFFS